MGVGAVSVRVHHSGPQGAKAKAKVIADILASIKERRADLRHPAQPIKRLQRFARQVGKIVPYVD